jgi:hypothetical protein
MRLSAGTAGSTGREETTEHLLRAAAEAAPPLLRGVRPWCLRAGAGPRVTELWASPSPDLRALDPTGRAVQIACGAALLRVRVAAAVAGREPVDRLLPRPGEPLLLATIRLAGPRPPSPAERALHAAIARPVTGGQPGGAPVPASVLCDLAQAAAIEGAVLDVVVASPAAPFRPTRPGPPPTGSQGTSGTLAVISARPGTRAGWLRTGQALQRVLLLAIAHDIWATPFRPVLEAPDGRLAEALLALGIEQPQVILQLSGAMPVAPGRR